MKEVVHYQFFVHEFHNTMEFDKYTTSVRSSKHTEHGPFEERDEAEEAMQKCINKHLQTGPWRRSKSEKNKPWLVHPDRTDLEIKFYIEKREVSRTRLNSKSERHLITRHRTASDIEPLSDEEAEQIGRWFRFREWQSIYHGWYLTAESYGGHDCEACRKKKEELGLA